MIGGNKTDQKARILLYRCELFLFYSFSKKEEKALPTDVRSGVSKKRNMHQRRMTGGVVNYPSLQGGNSRGLSLGLQEAGFDLLLGFDG